MLFFATAEKKDKWEDGEKGLVHHVKLTNKAANKKPLFVEQRPFINDCLMCESADSLGYPNFNTIFHKVFFNGICIIVARQQLVAELWSHLPFNIAT